MVSIANELLDVERTLQKARTELNKALSSLTDLDADTGDESVATWDAPYRDTRQPQWGVFWDRAGTFPRSYSKFRPQNVDFRAIFAQNGLLADSRSRAIALAAAAATSGRQCRNYTLPSAFRVRTTKPPPPETLVENGQRGISAAKTTHALNGCDANMRRDFDVAQKRRSSSLKSGDCQSVVNGKSEVISNGVALVSVRSLTCKHKPPVLNIPPPPPPPPSSLEENAPHDGGKGTNHSAVNESINMRGRKMSESKIPRWITSDDASKVMRKTRRSSSLDDGRRTVATSCGRNRTISLNGESRIPRARKLSTKSVENAKGIRTDDVSKVKTDSSVSSEVSEIGPHPNPCSSVVKYATVNVEPFESVESQIDICEPIVDGRNDETNMSGKTNVANNRPMVVAHEESDTVNCDSNASHDDNDVPVVPSSVERGDDRVVESRDKSHDDRVSSAAALWADESSHFCDDFLVDVSAEGTTHSADKSAVMNTSVDETASGTKAEVTSSQDRPLAPSPRIHRFVAELPSPAPSAEVIITDSPLVKRPSWPVRRPLASIAEHEDDNEDEEDGPPPPSPSPSQPSLLDSMHRKLYPDQYTATSGSGETPCRVCMELTKQTMAGGELSTRQRCRRCERIVQTKHTEEPNLKTNQLTREIEALEACKWLRAAGFPQYAQMYEDHLYPIDINCVENDHDFLDRDSIHSLFRRLNTLNKCATMKIDAPPRKTVDDSDEEDACALSDKWRYQRSSRRWSRRDLDIVPMTDAEETTTTTATSSPASPLPSPGGVPVMRSSSSRDSVLTDDGVFNESRTRTPLPEPPSPVPSAGSPSPLRRSSSDRFRGARNFLRRMESLKSRRGSNRRARLEIGSPVLVDTPQTMERLNQLGCVDISPTSPIPEDGRPSTSPSSPVTARHDGGTSPTSPEFFTLAPGYRPGSFPHLIGYADQPERSLNARTGSFNLGSTGGIQVSPPVIRRRHTTRDKTSTAALAKCISVYDNVPLSASSGAEGSAQHELDLILCDLFKNINGLNQSLQQYSADASDLSPTSSLSPSWRDAATSPSGGDQVMRTERPSQLDVCPATSAIDAANNNNSAVDMPPATVNGVCNGDASPPRSEDLSRRGSTPDSDGVIPGAKNQQMALADELESASSSLSNHEMSDDESPGSHEDDGSDVVPSSGRERRDSGVGSSLTRAPSERRRQRMRWHSFLKSHRPSLASAGLQLARMSAGQMLLLRKLCLLKITALMEKYSPSNRSGWNWVMPKFIKRLKAPDYRSRRVFGVPLSVVLCRTGQPLPQCVLCAMRCLRRNASDAVGVFRKSGVRSRIQRLRDQLERDPDSIDFDSLQAYDVADLLKQYFRELPECLLTTKLSETFISIFTHVPVEHRQEALQAAVVLMPDENRNVLQSLLLFLSDMAEHADCNQMTASNLAVCFAPSLFHMCCARGSNSNMASPRRSRKGSSNSNNSGSGIPDHRELMDQKAAQECLTQMINTCKKLFMIPDDMFGRCRLSYIEIGDPVPLEDLGFKNVDNHTDHTSKVESCIQGILKESRDKYKGWINVSCGGQTLDFAYKKLGDGHPLRLWKCSAEVEAPPVEVLNKILRERHLWDEDLLKWRVVEKLDSQTEVFQYVVDSMAPHPSRDFCVLRSWRTQLPKGGCILISTSVEHADAPLMGGVRAVVLASGHLIEPCGSGRSRLTYISRIDIRGHSPDWYNKASGHLCANYVSRIRDSFQATIANAEGPETKI